jgi:hypothetical protein
VRVENRPWAFGLTLTLTTDTSDKGPA